MIITLLEILYILITILVVGYIFSGMIKFQATISQNHANLFARYQLFNWNEIKLGILIAAPGIILHELAHKFTALAFGLQASYQIWPTGLLIGVVLKILNTGFILLAPGYVTILGASSIQSSITAFAGPAMNLMLWLGPYLILRYNKKLTKKTALILLITEKINMWLFIFNMIPLPPLDGFKVVQPLINFFI